MGRDAKPAKRPAKRPAARKSLQNQRDRMRRLQRRLEEALKREAEALEQQTATSEILKVIASSPTDVQPVFDAIARHAVALCDGVGGMVVRYDGAVMRLAAFHNVSAKAWELHQTEYPRPPDRTVPLGAAIVDRTIVHVPNLQASTRFAGSPVHRSGRASMIAVPLLRHGEAIGAIGITRDEPEGFSDRDIALLQTFADQAVIAIENVRLFNETKEALEQQTATSEILRVISSSPTDVRPVFDTIVQSARRLCGADSAGVLTYDGGLIHVQSLDNDEPERADALRRAYPRPANREHATGRAILTGRAVQIADVREDPEYALPLVRDAGIRSVLAVPMIRDGIPIGAIALQRWVMPQPFSDEQIGLLSTFADQAVIAVENVRLFTELQEKNRALTQAHAQVTETLEQQTATSEILRTIAHAQTDMQPVFETIVSNAVELCHVAAGWIWLLDGDWLRVTAAHNIPEDFPTGIRVTDAPNATRVIRDGATFNVADTEDDPRITAEALKMCRAMGVRANLAVPLRRDGEAIGALTVYRQTPGIFPDSQVELLKTFADQAVIAIENVRLFTELQASNRELTTALDTQTATSDILRVISRSQTDVQPVFDAILASAVRLLGGYTGALTRIAGDQIAIAATTGHDAASEAAVRAAYPQSLQAEGTHARAIRDRVPLNIVDYQTDPRLSEALRATAEIGGFRSLVVVPMLLHDEAVGAIGVTRRDPGGFTDDEIALLKTFADQAVIAIENARLLSELQARTQELTRSVEQLTALGDVGRAVSSSLDLDTVLTTIVGRAVQLSGTDGGTIFEYDEGTEEFAPRATLNADESQSAMLRATRLRRGEGAVGQMAVTREPIQIPDIAAEGAYEGRLRGALLEAGTRALLAIPLLHEERIVGGLVVSRRTPGAFTPEVVEILKTFATQSALAIQNARLFREIENKSRQLEVASQHKSEFLANMSHELRTPLNAIIGFSEVLVDRMFGELTEKQDEYLKDIYASGQHLLSLINDILDLSKIEAGRMELEVTDFDLPSAIDNALILVRERASRRGITLGHSVDERLGHIRGDERKVKQVLLNLLSNALKFTPEGGRIDVSAGVNNGVAEIAVADTGVGIAPEDQEAVFEEFRQVGTADKKVEGTGLGLALSRKFIELHGGRIWVKSQVGHGSTFTFTLPVRRED